MSDEINTADDMIKLIETRLNKAKGLNSNWGKTINLVFLDIDTGYAIKFAMDGSIEKIEKKPASEIKKENAEVTLSGQVDDLKQVVDGNITGNDAMTAGMFKIDGDGMALMKMMPAFPNPL